MSRRTHTLECARCRGEGFRQARGATVVEASGIVLRIDPDRRDAATTIELTQCTFVLDVKAGDRIRMLCRCDKFSTRFELISNY